MTLPGLPGSFRPGAPTFPQVTDASSGLARVAHLQFLSAEEKTTAALMGFFQQARIELEDFIRTGDLTVSDATFYRQLLDETNRIGSQVNAQGATWTSQVIPDAYSAGWRQNSSVVVPRKALEALSRDTLSLITQTSLGMRETIRQSIAAGILQGLPSDAVRQRILQSGLTNIPHWPNVEYRAGVIARTETMRAYNTGNIDAIVENGARFAEWIASPDEAVCSICGPRNGDIFRLPGVEIGGIVDPYGPAVRELPKIPAHPRCRCTTRAVYRGPDGQVIPEGPAPPPPAPQPPVAPPRPPPKPPKLPDDAMGGKEKPIMPPAKGDFEQALGKLNRQLMTPADRLKMSLGQADDVRPFWRGLGKFDEDMIRAVASFGKTNSNGHATFGNVLFARYGITLGKITGWNADLRMATLRALERIRDVNPAYVVDSKYLHTIGDRPPGAGRFGGNVIARAFASGQVEGNMKAWAQFAGPNGRKLRSGAGVDAAEEVIAHEFFHTIHNRYGLHDANYNPGLGHRYDAVEPVPADWHSDYQRIRSQTNSTVASADLTPDREVIRLREQADKWEAYGPGYSSSVERFRRQADALEDTLRRGGAEFYPTEYSKSSYAEDFAESGMLYMLNPAHLKKWSPRRYEFFRDRVMGGWEP